MSHLGASSAAPAAPPPGRDPSGIPGWVLVVATMVALAMTGALLYAIVGGSGGSTSPRPAAARHARHFPAHWDHRIAPYARIAAQDRGLAFEHPVPVRFLSPATFAKTLETDDQDLSKADRREIAHTTGLLRAWGLLSGDVDLLHAVNDFSGAAVLAYYSFADKRITVRGHRITPSVKATLVHELTHVLQDQHFAVGARTRALAKAAKKSSSSEEADVLRALIEGDADRVEGLYRSSLSPDQVKALDTAQEAEARQAQPTLGRIPKIVVTMLTSPYTLGEGLAQAADAAGGNAAVDRLLRQTPTHDVALLEPIDTLHGRLHTLHVATPGLQPQEEKVDSGELGALAWYLLLAARVSPPSALAAADGWAGDAYLGYRSDGRSCARMTFAGRTPADAARMFSSLQQWVGAGPASRAQVSTFDGRVTLDACDPGTGVQAGNDDSDKAVELVAVRTALAVGLLRRGATDSAATCMADRMVQAFPVASLEDPSFGADDPPAQASVARMAAACRG